MVSWTMRQDIGTYDGAQNKDAQVQVGSLGEWGLTQILEDEKDIIGRERQGEQRPKKTSVFEDM